MSHTPPSCFSVPAGTCYRVGGVVRDTLLGIDSSDNDYVVVGATPEQMIAAGFLAVGGHFPVFLHPQSKEEYALARTERKSGRGYGGFTFYAAPTVTLKEDLIRRDLTINAMAMDAAGNIIDYYGGQEDLAAGQLRHVSPAFAEDPLRILRVARFAATFPQFTIAADTMTLMQQMVAAGELNHLSKERIWRELARGLVAAQPSKMVQALYDCIALQQLLPEVAALVGVPERIDYHPEGESYRHTMMVIDCAAARGANAAENFAALLHDVGKAQTPAEILPSHHGHEQKSRLLAADICNRLKLPRAVTKLAQVIAAEHGNVHNALEMRAATLVDLLTRIGAFNNSATFESLLRICEADFYYWHERANQPYRQGAFLRRALAAAQTVDSAAVAQVVQEKNIPPASDKIAAAIRAARIKAIHASDLNSPPTEGGEGS